MSWYDRLARPILFALPAESAHTLVSVGLRAAHVAPILRGFLPRCEIPPEISVRVLGREWRSPVGLAAGFDKGATMYNALGALGFGGVEVGTVTALAQPGNPRPRLFRLREDRAVINRMGFNNPGADRAAECISARPPRDIVLGVNIGKSKATPLERADEDYAHSARRLGPSADYLVVNVSSPNTPGLRSLQAAESLRPIVRAVRRELDAVGCGIPLLVKIAPDLSDDEIDAVADVAVELRLSGLVATNTTVKREGLRADASQLDAIGAGGLSGPPLRQRALAVIRRVRRRTQGTLVLVGVGGIETADHAWEMLRAGASLVQVYTSLVYAGPTIAREINQGLAAKMRASGVQSLTEIVGRDA